MKVYIIGSGAVSSLYAGYLASGGMEVVMVARNREVAEAIRQNGLRLEGIGGSRTFKVSIVTAASADPAADLILICVKAYDTAGAVEQHLALLRSGAPVVSIQNGIGNVEEVVKRIGGENVLAGTTTMGGFVEAPGVVNHAGQGDTTIGEICGGVSERVRQIAQAITAAGLCTVASENISALLWTKLCVNVAINPMTALLRVRNGVLGEQEVTRAVALAAVDEVVAVAGRAGIALEREKMRARALEVMNLTAKNRSSMLTDTLKGKRTEIDFISGAVVRFGQEYQVATPVNETLTNLILALEQTRSKRVDEQA